jgi:hypothetical protein
MKKTGRMIQHSIWLNVRIGFDCAGLVVCAVTRSVGLTSGIIVSLVTGHSIRVCVTEMYRSITGNGGLKLVSTDSACGCKKQQLFHDTRSSTENAFCGVPSSASIESLA